MKAITVLFLIFAIGCSDGSTVNQGQPPQSHQPVAPPSVGQKGIHKDSLQPKFIASIRFISDSLLKGNNYVLKDYLTKYQTDTCGLLVHTNSELKDVFGTIKPIGDINGDRKADAVFVLPPFNYCDDGDAYVFLDTTLPRLLTDSYCCHPDNLFSIGDIDEDGLAEICIFYSSCASRFKSLIAYSLKKGQWKQVGRCTFDMAYMLPAKEKRVRKTGKGKFKMLEVNEKNSNPESNGVKKWQTFSF